MGNEIQPTLPVSETRKCHIALFDILGFRQLIEHDSTKSYALLSAFIQQTKSILSRLGEGCEGRVQVRVFQDTVVAYSSNDDEMSLRCLLRYSCSLIGEAFAEGVALRGAVTTGEVLLSETAVIGSAFIRAYEMEQSQEWVGGLVDEASVGKRADEDGENPFEETLTRYAVPRKGGPVRVEWAINWPRVMALHCEKKILRGWLALVEQGERFWQVRRKIDEVDSFLSHLVQYKWAPAGPARCEHGDVLQHPRATWLNMLGEYRVTDPEWAALAPVDHRIVHPAYEHIDRHWERFKEKCETMHPTKT